MILEPGKYYHLFSRGNNGGKIFFKKENYDYFIHSKILHYMSGYMDILAWALIPNHYHLTVLIKPIEDIFSAAEKDFGKIPYQVMVNLPELSMHDINLQNLKNLANLSPSEAAILSPSAETNNLQNLKNLANLDSSIPVKLLTKLASRLVTERLRRCLLGYAKAINKQENRTGSLFQKIIRRDHLPKTGDLKRNIAYVHRNPIHHKMSKDYHLWKHSSYNHYLNSNSSMPFASDNSAFEVFGGSDAFFEYHVQYLHRWQEQEIEEWE